MARWSLSDLATAIDALVEGARPSSFGKEVILSRNLLDDLVCAREGCGELLVSSPRWVGSKQEQERTDAWTPPSVQGGASNATDAANSASSLGQQAQTAEEVDATDVQEDAGAQLDDIAADTNSWFAGVISTYDHDGAYGMVESPNMSKPCHINGEDLSVAGLLDALVEKGEEFMFQLVEDEDQVLWAWPPFVPTTREYLGVISEWVDDDGAGKIHCDDLKDKIEGGVRVEEATCSEGGVPGLLGSKCYFKVSIDENGQPLACSLRPSDEEKDSAAASKDGPKTQERTAIGAEADRKSGGAVKRLAEVVPSGQVREGGTWKRPRISEEGKASAKGGVVRSQGKGPEYQGVLSEFDEANNRGLIMCPQVFAQSKKHVYIHGNVYDTITPVARPPVGSRLRFRLHYNKRGEPQASAPVYCDGQAPMEFGWGGGGCADWALPGEWAPPAARDWGPPVPEKKARAPARVLQVSPGVVPLKPGLVRSGGGGGGAEKGKSAVGKACGKGCSATPPIPRITPVGGKALITPKGKGGGWRMPIGGARPR